MMMIIALVTKLFICQGPYEAKYPYLIKNVTNGLENLEDPKAFIEYSSTMQDVYKNIEEYNPSRKCHVL